MSGRSVVKQDIPWGGVLAYSRGQTVDNDAVKANGWEDFVVSADTKEGREIQADITRRPVSDFETSSGTTTSTSRAAAKSTDKSES